MDTNLEKVALKSEVEKHLAESNASYFAINVSSANQLVIDYLKDELASDNVRVDAFEQCGTLPSYFGEIRDQFSSFQDVEIMLVSHDLGWPLIELSHLKMDAIKGLDDHAAIYASENTLLHGKPFYDEDVL